MAKLREQKSILFLLIFLFCLLKSNALQILKAYTQPNERTKIGETARLICQSDEWYDKCIWTHESSNCSFHGRRSPMDHPANHGKLIQLDQQKTCDEMQKRVLFKRDYGPTHDLGPRWGCEIELKNVTFSDQEEWSCYLDRRSAYCSRPSDLAYPCQAQSNLTLKVTPGIQMSHLLYSLNN